MAVQEVTIITAEEIESIITSARTHYGRKHSHSILLALDLWNLYASNAHKVLGTGNFSVWIEKEVGVPSSTVRGLVRQGRVLSVLARKERVDLDDPTSCPPIVALRLLAKVLNDRGDDAMTEVYDRALTSELGLCEAGIRLAIRDLFGPHPGKPDAPDPVRGEELYPAWLEDDGDEDGDVAAAIEMVVEDLDRLRILAKRGDRDGFERQLKELEIELAGLRELV